MLIEDGGTHLKGCPHIDTTNRFRSRQRGRARDQNNVRTAPSRFEPPELRRAKQEIQELRRRNAELEKEVQKAREQP